MHSILRIPEIYQLILENIHNPRNLFYGCFELEPADPFYCSARQPPFGATLVNLALTCKSLSDLPLDLLWYSHHDLYPLFRCFPSDLIKIQTDKRNGYRKTIRRILDSDFTRIQIYAKRIRMLDVCLGSVPSPFQDIFSIIASKLQSPLLPNLEYLRFSLEDFSETRWSPLPALLTSSRLRFIWMDVVDSEPDLSLEPHPELHQQARVWEAVAAKMQGAVPSLKSVTITYCIAMWGFETVEHDYHGFQVTPALIQTISTLSKTSALNLLNVEADAALLQAITSLENITDLAIHVSHNTCLEYLAHRPRPMSKLVNVVIGSENLHSIVRIISTFKPSNLRSLKIILKSRPTPNLDSSLQILATLDICESLQSIRIVHPTYTGDPYDDLPPINRETINTLSAFSQLRVIQISINSTVDLDGSALFLIARTWKNLNVLSLPEKTLHTIPRITLGDFMQWKNTLLHLEEVTLRMNCIIDGATHLTPLDPPLPTALHQLHVCTSPISDAPLIAALLINSSPKLASIGRGWKMEVLNERPIFATGMNRTESNYEQLWNEVDDIVKGTFENSTM